MSTVSTAPLSGRYLSFGEREEIAVAAVQILPTVELVQLSGRSEGLGFEEFAKMSLPPERLIAFLVPNAFGNPSTGTYWGREAGFFIQLCPYFGVLPLVLAYPCPSIRTSGATPALTSASFPSCSPSWRCASVATP